MSMNNISGQYDSRGDKRIYGVITGVVIKNKDPQGKGRVKVKFPCLTDSEMGYWARMAAPMAGGDRGILFLPEEKDEVLVVFEEGDISRPYIIGALWNGKDKPPYSNEDGKNNLRIIKSRSGHIIRLDDTDGSEKIEIIDKSSKNSITIDTAKNSISIKSEKDISIDAPNGIIRLNSKSIEVSSSAETKVDAKAGLELKSSGNTVIKGATVNIN
ncbi:MAG: phage baseplate assembly protein V [Clostridia bacterium]|nr:phage baseplate assembly protein V [Clostridia bacterium]